MSGRRKSSRQFARPSPCHRRGRAHAARWRQTQSGVCAGRLGAFLGERRIFWLAKRGPKHNTRAAIRAALFVGRPAGANWTPKIKRASRWRAFVGGRRRRGSGQSSCGLGRDRPNTKARMQIGRFARAELAGSLGDCCCCCCCCCCCRRAPPRRGLILLAWARAAHAAVARSK
jgi:hypothetical protein